MRKPYTNPKNVSDVRKKAWETRRAMYGQRGHRGSYYRGNDGALRLVIRLLSEEALSEGQVAQETGLDRVAIRRMVADLHNHPPTIQGREE